MIGYTVRRGDQQFGPYEIDQIKQYFAAGRLLPNDLVWHQGAVAWEPLSQVVADLGPPAPPPPSASPPPPPGPDVGINPIQREFPEESKRYSESFKKFDSNGGKFVTTFNPWAFLFGVFWYCYKGMWKKGLLYFGFAIVTISIMGDVGAFVVPAFCAIMGNYDYYLFRTQRKDFAW